MANLNRALTILIIAGLPAERTTKIWFERSNVYATSALLMDGSALCETVVVV